MVIRRYNIELLHEWNAFVDSSKNGTFLFKREYMEYHSSRFKDHSLMFYNNKNRLVAVLPANSTETDFYSHQGLTYGGFVLSTETTTEMVLELFSVTLDYLKSECFRTFTYKQMPTCYHLYPSEEDEYALWLNDAELSVCNISATILLDENCGNINVIPFERRRRRGIVRAEECGYNVEELYSPDLFWPVMEENLMQRYNASPVHSLDEMCLLMQRFPENIKCFATLKDGRVEAGAIIYITQQTVHVQYAHASATGKKEGALDLLYSELIKMYKKKGMRYFDIGTSNENGGKYLNTNLIAQKEVRCKRNSL